MFAKSYYKYDPYSNGWFVEGLPRDENNPITTTANLYDMLLYEQEEMRKMYEELTAAEKEQNEHNQSVIFSLTKAQRKSFKELVDSSELSGKIEIVEEAFGEEQSDEYDGYGKIFVDQRCVGIEGDSFAGSIYAQLSENKWLKIPYSC